MTETAPPQQPLARSRLFSREKRAFGIDGILLLGLAVLAAGSLLYHFLATSLGLALIGRTIYIPPFLLTDWAFLTSLAVTLLLVVFGRFYMLQPNEAAVLTLFGSYAGTDRRPGLRWTWRFLGVRKISVRVRNLFSGRLKVNDRAGNPVEVGVNVVWRVEDTAKALFDVDDYKTFIDIQADTALREVAARYPYDKSEEAGPALRSDADLVSQELQAEIQRRVTVAGLVIDDARLTHLAYAPEIAGVMLRRQQAEAVLAARRIIVDGAVSIVEQALKTMAERNVADFVKEHRAALVSNLLVVLCAEQGAQPVVNIGLSPSSAPE